METATALKTTMNIIHEVADFATWHKGYLDHSPTPVAARLGILRNIDNPNLLFVGEVTESHAAARTFLESENLKEAMKASGVISVPEIRLMNMHYFNPDPKAGTYHVTVTHHVADFKAWKTVFDSDEENRQSIGLQLLGLGNVENNPSEVLMMFATNDVEAVKAKFRDPKMAEVMKAAGVSSAPAINFWKMA